jgi:large subunit ribosomal protein L29
MNAEKIREIDTADLRNQLREQEEQMFRIRFQLGMGQAEGLNKYRELRRDRARMLGILRERELDPSRAAAAEALKSSAGKGKRKK